MLSYYEILGIPSNASQEQVREAYIAICKDLHPDKLRHLNENLRKLAEERIKLVNEAYEILRDVDSRRMYDDSLFSGRKEDIPKSNKSNSNNDWPESLDSLLSSSILEKGFSALSRDEEDLLEHFLGSVKSVNERFYSISYIFPDTMETKVYRYFRLIWVIFIVLPFGFSAFSLVLSFLSVIAFWIIPLVGSLASLFLVFIGFPLLTICYIATAFFVIVHNEAKEIYTREVRDNYQVTEGIFSVAALRYWKSTRDIGSYFRWYKLISPVYTDISYVYKIDSLRNNFDSELATLLRARVNKLNQFLKLPLDKLTTSFVASLSESDRLLLVIALKKRAEEERKKAQAEQGHGEVEGFLKVAGAIALLGIFFGGGGF